ncbi:hypothetical protein ACWDSJ_00540 [Nocardia sp. NPDC003482]
MVVSAAWAVVATACPVCSNSSPNCPACCVYPDNVVTAVSAAVPVHLPSTAPRTARNISSVESRHWLCAWVHVPTTSELRSATVWKAS